MFAEKIEYSQKFIKEFNKLPEDIINLAIKKETVFRDNPLHPSLRLHELHGKFKEVWSLSITSNYRIIFKRKENGTILFISIGRHDIYKYL
ncbi:TPA: type II toxin-antitoxin system mRNA interferase toxin, RelE/StbE family [Candidatus Uhrbacteria bacterium]|nr:type II toxin-antitoxin system mRNA interferase toxin, RelE/StbE family [Candidatus Uhrbacteria bacterium]